MKSPRGAELGLTSVGIAWAVLVASVLLKDARATTSTRAACAAAIAAAVAALVRVLLRRGFTSTSLLAGAVVAGSGIYAYPIGGLALLGATLFLWSAAGLSHLQRTRGSTATRRTAWILLGLGIVVMPLSMLDPGGLAFIVVPVFAPLTIWALVRLGRQAAQVR